MFLLESYIGVIFHSQLRWMFYCQRFVYKIQVYTMPGLKCNLKLISNIGDGFKYATRMQNAPVLAK